MRNKVRRVGGCLVLIGGADEAGFLEDGCVFRNCGVRMELRAVVLCLPATIKVGWVVASIYGKDPPDVGLE
jgi:hypothetical protein